MKVSVPMEVETGACKDGFHEIVGSGPSGIVGVVGEDGIKVLDHHLMVQDQTGKGKGNAMAASDERVFTELNKIEENILGGIMEALLNKLSEERSADGISSRCTSLDPQGYGDLHILINYLCKSKEIVEEEISLLKQEKLQLQSELESAWRITNEVQSLLHEQRKISRTLLIEKFKSLQFQKKLETLTKEKKELSKENEALFKQLEDAQQIKMPMGDDTNIIAMKRKEKEMEKEMGTCIKSANASMARFPSDSVLDDQTAANTSLSNGVGVPVHPLEASPLVDVFTPASGSEIAAGAPRNQSLMMAAASSSKFNPTIKKITVFDVPKSNVEIHSAGWRPRKQAKGPTGDIVISNAQRSFHSLEKEGETCGPNTHCDLASSTLSSARKHLPSSSATELHEELLIQQKTGSIASVHFLKKSKVSDSPQEGVEGGQALVLPTLNIGKVLYVEVLSDAAGDLDHVLDKAAGAEMDEGQEPKEPPPLDGRSPSLPQKELCAVSEDGLDQMRGVDEVFKKGSRDGKVHYLQQCSEEVGCDKGKGALVPDVKEKQDGHNMSARMSVQETVEGHCEPMNLSIAHSALAASTVDKVQTKLPEPLDDKMEIEDSLKAVSGPFGPCAERSKTELCKFLNSASGSIRGANCNSVRCRDQTKTVPLWLTIFNNWLPGFLQEKWWCSGGKQWYPLSSLKADFRDKCNLDLDHESLGYPYLNGFMLFFNDICHMVVKQFGETVDKGQLALVPPNFPVPLSHALLTSKKPHLSSSNLRLLCDTGDNSNDNDMGKSAEGKTVWTLKSAERSNFSQMMSSQEKEKGHAEGAAISVTALANDKIKTTNPVLLDEKTNGHGANKEISKTFCKFFNFKGNCTRGASCRYVHSLDHAKNLPTWVTTFRTWLPGFLRKKWACQREEQWYHLSSLKKHFWDKCDLELDYASLGYPNLSHFMQNFHEVCHLVANPSGVRMLVPPGYCGPFQSPSQCFLTKRHGGH